jgi:hypothetical protein
MRASAEAQQELVRHALARRRTLVVVDNLEAGDDDEVIDLLRDLPAPSKAIVNALSFPCGLSRKVDGRDMG